MAIEAITKTAMTYQGSTPSMEVPQASGPAKEANANVSADSAAEDAKAASALYNAEDGEKSSGVQGEEEAAPKVGAETIKKAVSEMNKKFMNCEAVFGVHEDTNRIMIKIVDKDTKKVLREFPPEKTLDMIAKVWEMAGIMVDEKR